MMLKERIADILVSHESWKTRLLHAIDTGHSAFEVGHVGVDDRCELGNWLYHQPPAIRRQPIWRAVQTVHSQFHHEAARVLSLALAGHRREALASLEDHSRYALLSRALTQLLREWKNPDPVATQD